MKKTFIDITTKERTIKISSKCIQKELIDLISLACCYNASYEFNEDTSVFSVICNSDDSLEKLQKDYEKYFFSK